MKEKYFEYDGNARRAKAASEIVAMLIEQQPQPIIEGTDLQQQQFIQITDRQHGWDAEGNYH